MRRVVVTGIGAVTPLGVGARRTWNRLLAGDCGITSVADREPKQRWKELTCTVGGIVPTGDIKDGGWDASNWLSAAEQRRMSRFTQYAIAASEMALRDAECDAMSEADREETGVCLGSGIGNLDDIYMTSLDHDKGGYKKVSPLFVPKILTNMAAGHIAMKYGFHGPNHAATTACTTGAHSIGDASRFIALGDADVMVAGGSESCIHPLTFAGFGRARSLATAYNDRPEASCRPFDAGRDGFVVGEGAAVVVLETLDRAQARGARIYAEIKGYGCSGDAYHMTAPREDGQGAFLAMKRALRSAGIKPAQVGYINAHATSTQVGDAAETMAIKRIMMGEEGLSNEGQVTVSSTKGAVGHLLGAAGAIEAVFTILALHEGIIPATLNLEKPNVSAGFDFVPLKAKGKAIEVALSNSFGFGGTNSSLVFTKFRTIPALSASLPLSGSTCGKSPPRKTTNFQPPPATFFRWQFPCIIEFDVYFTEHPVPRTNTTTTRTSSFESNRRTKQMACQSCRSQTRSLLRSALRTAVSAPAAARSITAPVAQHATTTQLTAANTLRMFSTSSSRQMLGGSLRDTYRVVGASERLFKVCAKPADYHITDEDRKKDLVERRDDGEELGVPTNPDNVWNKTFGLQPSFSTWSHVTMLHLYLVNARLRCFERDEYRNWSQQMIDHFFFECEKKMHLDHNITSAALRQRYLKDIFVQWRGLLLAYDEGLVKGDAVLASAVWRNLFKGAADVDPRALVAIVGWMRAGLASLEGTSDVTFPQQAAEILEKPVDVFWTRLEAPFLSDQAAPGKATPTEEQVKAKAAAKEKVASTA